jgi:hypothetical protein
MPTITITFNDGTHVNIIVADAWFKETFGAQEQHLDLSRQAFLTIRALDGKVYCVATTAIRMFEATFTPAPATEPAAHPQHVPHASYMSHFTNQQDAAWHHERLWGSDNSSNPVFPLSNPLVVMMETIQNRHTDDLTTRVFRQANFT